MKILVAMSGGVDSQRGGKAADATRGYDLHRLRR